MKKVVLKGILGCAALVSSFTVNAQIIVEENFQGFGDLNYLATKPNTTCTGQPDEKSIELKRTYASGTAVTYTLVNAGVSSTCPVKGGTNATITKVGSNGYVELGKNSEYATSGLTGSLTISKLTYVGTLKFNASWTGGNRKTPALRGGELYKSEDNLTWTPVEVTTEDPELVGFSGDVYGGTYSAIINGSYFIKFASITDPATENRYRIHDITIDATLVGVTDMFLDGSATVAVNQKTVQVKSAASAVLEIVGLDGKVLHSKNIAAGSEESLQVSQSGMYVVRLVAGNNASVQKIIVQ